MKNEVLLILNEFPNILRELRKSSNFTQKFVADNLKITLQSYNAYERGIAVPTLENFIKLSILFDVSLDCLIGKNSF